MEVLYYYKKAVFENYANFRGRARRSEYWYFVLVNIFLLIAYVIVGGLLSDTIGFGEDMFACGLVFSFLALIVPTLALIVRRLHDTGNSGWMYLIRFVPVIGPIWFLILMCKQGVSGSNKYGVDPKQTHSEIDDIGIDIN